MKLKFITVTLVVMLIASAVYADEDNDVNDDDQTVQTGQFIPGLNRKGKFHKYMVR